MFYGGEREPSLLARKAHFHLAWILFSNIGTEFSVKYQQIGKLRPINFNNYLEQYMEQHGSFIRLIRNFTALT